jgi:hypothetical protein
MPTRAAPVLTRSAWAAMLALVLALRLMTPTGFMPSFDDGPAVVPCDGIVAAPPPMKMAHRAHHDGHQHGTAGHQTCPYAAGASPALLPLDSFAGIEPPLISATAVAAFAAAFVLRSRQDRPPSTGPPAAA